MKYIDANIILRYLLKDNIAHHEISKKTIDGSNKIFVLNEVVAEVVYVLNKTY